jgi:tRNA pseudouridine65 synthase
MRTQREEIQEAQTRYRTIERYELPIPHGPFPTMRAALVELTPLTGRRHQLRRHMAHLSHPIIGDATHGKGSVNRALAELLGVKRLWLHAGRLEFKHPVSQEAVCIEAALGPEWGSWREKGRIVTLG